MKPFRPNLVLQVAIVQAAATFLSACLPALSQPSPTVPAGRPPVSSTTFLCGQSGNRPATLVQVSGRTLQSPLIVWQTNYFGSEYTPEQRCQIVSSRLSQAVAQNGGRLSNLRLAHGTVNSQTVICYTNGRSSCDANNMLFTLKPENASNPQAVLSGLLNFAQRGSGNAVYESGGIDSGAEDSSISLEEAVNRAIQAESGGLTAPEESSPADPPNSASTPAYADPAPLPASPEAGAYPSGI